MVIDYFRQGTYNISLAHSLGLEKSIFISAFIASCNISDAISQIDKDKIQMLTTFSQKKQETILNSLKELNIFSEKEDNLYLNIDVLSSYLSIDTGSKQKVKTSIQKRTKSDSIREELKTFITATNPEMRDCYKDWIDAVYAKQGWMSKKSVQLGQNLIDEYCNHNLDLALSIINIAAINAYRDMQWAINSYEQNNKSLKNINQGTMNPIKPRAQVEVSSEVF